MKLTDRIYLVGSGLLGLSLTDDHDCNVYLLDAGDSAVLIDSGAGLRPDRIATEIAKDGFDPHHISHLIVSHGHADHAGGAAALEKLTESSVVCSAATARVLREGDEASIALPESRRAGLYPQDYRLHTCTPSIEVKHGDRLRVGDLTIEFVETPGHSADMISCYVPELKAMFCSDLLFAGGKIAMLPTPDFSFFDLANSTELLSHYEVEGLFPGHFFPRLKNGGDVIRQVRDTLQSFKIPPNIV